MVTSARLRTLGDLTRDFVQQISDENVALDQRHFRLLLNLSAAEKQALAKVVCEWNWNVGSPTVMKFLQKTNILNMSDVIVYNFNQDAESAQLILNDLLETEFILLADLLKHANSTELCDILNEGFRRLCCEAIETPAILVKNYLIEVQEFLLDESIEDVRMMHLNLLLQDGKHSAVDSLSNQIAWNNEVTDDHTVFKSFFASIVGCDYPTRQKTFQTILDKCTHWEQQNWKNLLLLLRIVVDSNVCSKFNCDQRNEFKAMAKKFIKDTFRRSVDDEDENGFYVFFMVARQLTRYNESLLGNYANWFKETIGEMKYFLKAGEYSLAMQQLAGMVQLENDLDILDVHITTYMPAPPRCNELVLNYKELCRCRQAHLRTENNPKPDKIIDDDVFLIEDD